MPHDRLPKPWTLRGNDDAFWIEAANGAQFGYCYFTDAEMIGTGETKLTRDAARRAASRIAKLGQ